MTTVTLLKLPDEERARIAFAWEHDIIHRKQSPTFLLDPLQGPDWPGSKWHLDHQISHNQLNPRKPRKRRQGMAPFFILRDTDLSNPGQRAWWEFANHHEHYYAG